MYRNYVMICLYGILIFFVANTEAIIGGKETAYKPYRYMVALLELDYGHICGGAIIGDQHILTAAHCFIYSDDTFKSKRVFALMGTKDILKMTAPAVNIEVEKVFVPWEFNASNPHTTGDIAVLKLASPIKLKHNSLKRAYREKNREKEFSGKQATITGWGWNQINLQHNEIVSHSWDTQLRYATADVFDYDVCKRLHPNLTIYEEHLCARVEQHEHGQHGVCFGDDGGPLVHNDTVIGILSKVPSNCIERNGSAIYTRVSHYLTFIRNALADYTSKFMRVEVLRPQ